MSRWIFSGTEAGSATCIPSTPNANPFAFAPPLLSKWPEVKVPTREYVDHVLGQTFAVYSRYNDRVATLGESDSESDGENMGRSPNKKRRYKPDIVRVNNIPFRMHELFEAVCARGIPHDSWSESERAQVCVYCISCISSFPPRAGTHHDKTVLCKNWWRSWLRVGYLQRIPGVRHRDCGAAGAGIWFIS